MDAAILSHSSDQVLGRRCILGLEKHGRINRAVPILRHVFDIGHDL